MAVAVATSDAGVERDAPAREPLVLAAVVFLAGVALGRAVGWAAASWLAGAGIFLLAWMVLEWIGWSQTAGALLMAAIVLAGAGLWGVNQEALGPMDVAWFAAADERPVTMRGARCLCRRMRAINPPAAAGGWRRRARCSRITAGWRPADRC